MESVLCWETAVHLADSILLAPVLGADLLCKTRSLAVELAYGNVLALHT